MVNLLERNRRICKLLIFLLLTIVLFKDSLSGYPFFSSIKLRLVDDFIVFFLYVWMIADYLKSRSRNVISSFYLLFFLVFFFFNVVQSIVLMSPLNGVKYVFFVRDNFWYFPVFYFSVKYLRSKQLLKYLNYFIYVQFLFVLLQVLFFWFLSGRLLVEDNINGSLGSNASHILSYCLLLLTPAYMARRKKYFLYIALVIVVLASARSAIFFTIISFTICYFYMKVSLKRFLIMNAVLFLFVVPLFSTINNYQTATLNPSLLLSQQQSDLKVGAGAARISFFLYSMGKVDTLKKALFGYGTSSYSSRSAIQLNGKEYQKFENDFLFDNEFITGGSTYNAWIVEYGVLVFFLLLVFFFYPVIYFRFQWYEAAPFLIIFLGLSTQKLMESYSVGLLYWIVFAYLVVQKGEIHQQYSSDNSSHI